MRKKEDPLYLERLANDLASIEKEITELSTDEYNKLKNILTVDFNINLSTT